MRYFLGFFIFFLAGCSQEGWNEKLSTPEDRKVAEQSFKALQSGSLVDLKDMMAEQAYTDTLKLSKSELETFSSSGDLELVTVSSNSNTTDGQTITTKTLNYQYGLDQQWFLYQVVLLETADGPIIQTWYITAYDVKPTTVGEFDFADKSFIHYFWLLAMIASTATIIVALIAAIRSKGIKRRWLWILGCLFGFVKFSLNWTTAEWGFQIINLSLFGSSYLKFSPFDAWVMSFSFPIVAIIFLWKRSSLMPEHEAE